MDLYIPVTVVTEAHTLCDEKGNSTPPKFDDNWASSRLVQVLIFPVSAFMCLCVCLVGWLVGWLLVFLIILSSGTHEEVVVRDDDGDNDAWKSRFARKSL